MNGKYFGEIGQNVVIGELSKYGIQVAVPLGDNLPFDLIAIVDNRLYKLQVKSSSQGVKNEYVTFVFSTNNFYNGEIKHYSKQEVDVMVGVDLRNYQVYLFDDFESINSINIRSSLPKNGQKKGLHWHDDFVLNASRVKDVFNFESPDHTEWFAGIRSTTYSHTCQLCEKVFSNGSKNAKYCGSECAKIAQRRVVRPDSDVLKMDIETLSWRAIGMKYGVSDNAVRKWAKSYGIVRVGGSSPS